MASDFPALLELDIGMADETDVAASRIATELDLGLTPRLPAVVGGSGKSAVSSNIPGLPADAAASMARSKEMADKVYNQLQTNMDMGNESARAYANAIVDSVEADQTIDLVAQTAALVEQNRNIEIDAALGGHKARVDRAKDAREFEIELEALAKKRADILDDKHTGIGILDDVINSFRVIRTEVELETTAQQNAINQQAIVEATAINESAAKANALVKKNINEGTIAANQRLIAAAGDAKLYEAILTQNQSNAEALQAMLTASNAEISNIMRGYELAGSIEHRQIQKEKHQLALREFEQRRVMNDVALRRSLIAEEREKLMRQVEAGTADAKVESQLVALDQQKTALDQAELNLMESEATSDDRIASAKLARANAETALDAANLAFDRNSDPAVDKALQDARDLAAVNLARAEYEFEELENTEGLRLASRQGAVEAQSLNIRILKLTADAEELTAKGKSAEALAKLDEARSLRVNKAEIEAENTAAVQSYMSFILGADRVEQSSAVINQQLQANNPAYLLMRQLGSVRGPKGEFILGSTAAEANKRLAFFEENFGVINNNLKQVRVLKEVRAIIEAEDQENPSAAAALDDISRDLRFNKKAAEYLSTKQSNIVFNDPTNPFKPPTIPQLTAIEGSTLAKQPLFAKVLIPDNTEEANPDEIIAKGIVAMQADTLTQEEVVEGIVSMGNTMAITINADHHGMVGIGLPYVTEVNMRVAKPRQFIASVLDSIQSTPGMDLFVAGGSGIIAAGALVGAPLTSGATLPAVGPSLTTALAASGLVSAFGYEAMQESSDFTTLNIADPIAVRQHLLAILSSSTLGGEDTDDVLKAAGAK